MMIGLPVKENITLRTIEGLSRPGGEVAQAIPKVLHLSCNSPTKKKDIINKE